MLLLALSAVAAACGPYFEHPRLSWVGRSMLDAPASRFDEDLRILARLTPPPPGVQARRKTTAQGDAEDLRAALPDADEALIAAWLSDARGDLDLSPYPAEFSSYILGARALYAGDTERAAQTWEALLALPEDQRRHRSTWAAFMLPATRTDTDAALADYQRVRDLVAAGYPDTLGLAAASLRHSATLLAGEERWGEAIAACVRYRAAGGQAYCTGLKGWVEQALVAPDLTGLLAEPLAAEVVGIYLTTGDVPGDKRWLAAAEEAVASVPAADRLAWASYQRGDFEGAQRWIDRSDPEAPMAWWMTAKLALRRGERDEAIAALQHTVALLPAPGDTLFTDFPQHIGCAHSSAPSKAARIELGIALVAADRYEEALTAFLSAGDWLDGAWVAERLLTTDALIAYVEHWFPDQRSFWWPPHNPVENLLDGEDLPLTQVPASIRHLLARRLAREGRWAEALDYYPEYDEERQADEILTNLTIGHDPTVDATTRGEALWAAAWSWKMNGWDLVATELEPDFRVLGGWYEGSDTTGYILNPSTDWFSEEDLLAHRNLAPSPAQLDRLAASGPSRRYHFVWTAQELAWEAVNLLPGDHADFLQAGCIAGTWTRIRDPQSADRFWKLMYERARRTPEGAALFAQRGWFTGLNDEGRCDLPAPVTESRGCSALPSDLPPTGLLSLPVLLGWRARRRRSPSR